MSDLSVALTGCEKPFKLTIGSGTLKREVLMKCGKVDMMCETCKTKRKKQWTQRLIAESQMHLQNSFVTLTYDNANLPQNVKSGYEQVKKFLETLRNRKSVSLTYFDGTVHRNNLNNQFRFYCAGEFGPLKDRLHWHLILFGQAGFPKGKTQCDAWKNGFVTWEPVTVSRLAYAASYSTKKSAEHRNFFQTSMRPGLGHAYWTKVGQQVYHLGKSPLVIRSLQIGSSHYPLDTFARTKLLDSYIRTAEHHNDAKALEQLERDQCEFRKGQNQTKDFLHAGTDGKWLAYGEENWQTKGRHPCL